MDVTNNRSIKSLAFGEKKDGKVSSLSLINVNVKNSVFPIK